MTLLEEVTNKCLSKLSTEFSSYFIRRIKVFYAFDNYCHVRKNKLIVTKDDMVYGFGGNNYGVLGLGHNNIVNEPKIIPELNNKHIIEFKNGKDFCLALSEDGCVYHFGNNFFETQYESRRVYNKPKLIKNIRENVISIYCGEQHSLLLTFNGDVYAWGNNQCGQIGNNGTRNQPLPVKIIGIETKQRIHLKFWCKPNVCNQEKITQIACGAFHSMALTDRGSVFSWGSNYWGQLGINSNKDSNIPVKVKCDQIFKQISCGSNHSLILSMGGVIYSFGSNGDQQLGFKCDKQLIPRMIVTDKLFTDICCLFNESISMAIAMDSFCYVWGKCSKESVLLPKKIKSKSFEKTIFHRKGITVKSFLFNDETPSVQTLKSQKSIMGSMYSIQSCDTLGDEAVGYENPEFEDRLKELELKRDEEHLSFDKYQSSSTIDLQNRTIIDSVDSAYNSIFTSQTKKGKQFKKSETNDKWSHHRSEGILGINSSQNEINNNNWYKYDSKRSSNIQSTVSCDSIKFINQTESKTNLYRKQKLSNNKSVSKSTPYINRQKSYSRESLNNNHSKSNSETIATESLEKSPKYINMKYPSYSRLNKSPIYQHLRLDLSKIPLHELISTYRRQRDTLSESDPDFDDTSKIEIPNSNKRSTSRSNSVSNDINWTPRVDYFRKNFVKMNDIAKGSSGSVLKVWNVETKAINAVKRIPIEFGTVKNDEVWREIGILTKLKSDHIVEYKQSWIEKLLKSIDNREVEYCLYIEMELCLKTMKQLKRQLFKELKCQQSICETPIGFYIMSEILKEVIEGVNYLHNNKVIHRDLKPENILIVDRKNGRYVKIADFGLAVFHDSDSQSHSRDKGTIKYMAPEVLTPTKLSDKRSKYNNKVDIYSLGVIFNGMFDTNNDSIQPHIKLYEKMDALKDIINRMKIRNSPNKRPDCLEIMHQSKFWSMSLKELTQFTELEEISVSRNSTTNDVSMNKHFHLYFLKYKFDAMIKLMTKSKGSYLYNNHDSSKLVARSSQSLNRN